MPFDCLAQTETAPDATTLFRERREKAAALWRSVPLQSFSIKHWDCGTAACALGWLAKSTFEGWSMRYCVPAWEERDNPYRSAMSFFGISYIDATGIFSMKFTAYPHRIDAAEITPSDVADALLAAPYVID